MELAVYIGRFSPLHLGHEAVIKKMIEDFGLDKSIIMVGSCNNPQSLRHFFTYEERSSLIKEVFPEIITIPLPDYPTDEEWLLNVWDLVSLRFAPKILSQDKVIFYGGCAEDVYFLKEKGWQVKIINRFDGATPKISATEVRDALIAGRNLENLVNFNLINKVQTLFGRKWNEFRRK